MERRPDWLQRLDRYLVETLDLPFEWGREDCATWAAGAVEAMTGEDFAAYWRGKYATKAEGLAVLRAAGFRSHFDLAAARLEEIPVGHAQTGDVLALEGDTLGIMQGRYAYAKADRGWTLVPLEMAQRAFRV